MSVSVFPIYEIIWLADNLEDSFFIIPLFVNSIPFRERGIIYYRR